MAEARRVRIEEEIGPNKDKHAITIGSVRQVHNGPTICADCQRRIGKPKLP